MSSDKTMTFVLYFSLNFIITLHFSLVLHHCNQFTDCWIDVYRLFTPPHYNEVLYF